MSFALPKRYVSQTLISVDTTDPRTIGSQLASQMPGLLAEPAMISIIQSENLYPRERARMPMSDVVDLMRKNIALLGLRNSDGRGAPGFILQFSYPDPHVAQRVDEELTSQFAVSNLRAAINNSSDVSRPPMTFRVEHVANLPQNPTFPKPRLFGVGGLIAGLVGGLIAATIMGRRRRLTVANG
jgi:hypothetical protein